MKYGYMNYRKHFLPNRNERPMNLGDPIQSFAVLEMYKEMGIPDKDIIPLDRYDLADYVGEECIVLINGAENYEHFAYATRFLPVSRNIHPVFISLHLHRELSEKELETLHNNQPIGCRDEYTVNYLRSKGIDAFLTGCLTMLFPKRDDKKIYEKVFIVDCSDKVLNRIPDEIKSNAEYLSQVVRVKSNSVDYRLTLEETEQYNELAKNQLHRYRDEAKLVITSRLHVASPCAAMGIPVVLVRDTFDERYQFIDRFLPLLYPDDLDNLDWNNIKTEIPKQVKTNLMGLCRDMLGVAEKRWIMKDLYSTRPRLYDFTGEEEVAVRNLPMNKDDSFDYCIWGVCMPNSYLLYEEMQKRYPNARLLYAIDTYATGIYKDNVRIIHPNELTHTVHNKAWILVIAPAAHETAREKLLCNYSFALIKGSECKTCEKL